MWQDALGYFISGLQAGLLNGEYGQDSKLSFSVNEYIYKKKKKSKGISLLESSFAGWEEKHFFLILDLVV